MDKSKLYLMVFKWAGALTGVVLLILALTLDLSARTMTGDSPVSVSITTSGFDPDVVTITVKAAVTWTNYTQETVHLVSGDPYRIYLPLILRNVDGNHTVAATAPTTDIVITEQQDDWGKQEIAPGKSYTYTFTTTGNHPYFLAERPGRTGLIVVQADPNEYNIPCLVVVGQHLPPEQPLPPVLAGCVAGTGSITWRYDYRGAFIGFDLAVKDNGTTIYEASIDIQRAANGRITSYGGTVSGEGFPDFTENVVNTYNPQGGLVGADVTKAYTASEDEYAMEITKYCPMATGSMSGYKVQFSGQEIVIGSCP